MKHNLACIVERSPIDQGEPRSALANFLRCIIIAIAAVVLSCQAGCNRKPPAAAMLPPDVEVINVTPRDVPVYREWIGTLDGLVHAHVHPQVNGYLLAVYYKEGTLLKRGDLMFEIDARPFQAVLDQAMARLGKDELDVNRLKPLIQENAVSHQELDDAMQAYLGDKAAADQARLNVEFTKVTSPIDGLAGLATAQIGDLVGPGTEELTTVSSVNPIKAYFPVSEQDYVRYMKKYLDQPGGPEHEAEISLDLILVDGTLYPRKGQFYAVDNQIDPRTGALRVAALFPNPENTLLPGQFARVRHTQVQRDALVIPQRAVMELQGSYQVAVVGEGDKVQIRMVKVGERAGSMWIIEDGLKTGDRVVVEGLQKVRDDTVVHPVPFTESTATNSIQTETR
jgi:membrane fusion protein (multidrug efflux system)